MTDRARRWWHRHGAMLRVWGWFVCTLAVLIQLAIWARPFTDGPFAAAIAGVAATLLRLLGNHAVVDGTLIRSSLGTAEIIRECTGVYPTLFYVAAVVAFPATWPRRLAGIALGAVAIQLLNQLRIVSLVYVLHWRPELFETAHLVVWQSLVVFFVALLFILWASELGGGRRRAA